MGQAAAPLAPRGASPVDLVLTPNCKGRTVRALFGNDRQGKTLADYCQARAAAMEKEVDAWDSDKLLGTPDQDAIDYLVEKYSVTCPVLRTEDTYRTDPVRTNLPARPPIPGTQFALGPRGPRTLPGTTRTFIVPFDGDLELFFRRQNPYTNFTSSMPDVEIQEREVRIHWAQPDREPADPERINAFVNKQVADLQLYLDRTATQVEQFNRQLAQQALQLVAFAKQRIAHELEVAEKLEFPLKRRPDSDQFLVPVERRPLTMRSQPAQATAPLKPQHVLADRAFEDVLQVLIHSRNALERSPSLAEKLGEDQIRDILLISLNAVFEGAATGETFNHLGKTDILVRIEDTNVFIGECKVWKTEELFVQALDDQLLRYLTWRDTKGALLLFIRNQGVTPVIDKAIALIQQHPNFVQALPGGTDYGRRDFILHAKGDPQKKIHLAFLPFALGPVSKRKKSGS